MAQVNIEKIHLAAIETPEFSIQAAGGPSDKGYTLNQRVSVEHDVANTFVLISLRVACAQVRDDESNQTTTGRFHFRFFFNIDDLGDLMVESPPNPFPIVDPNLAATLTSIAYSTARGMIWARTAGTPLEGFGLPIINPMKLLVESSQADTAEKNKAQAE